MFDPRAKILNEFIYHFFIQGIIVLVGSQHFPKNEQFLSPWDAHVRVRIKEKEMLVFRKILQMY